MNTQTLDKNRWDGFLNQLSKGVEGRRAEISVASLELGDQVEAEWLPFLGMTYDRKSDAIEVILEGLEEVISHPQKLSYVEDAGSVYTFGSTTVIDTSNSSGPDVFNGGVDNNRVNLTLPTTGSYFGAISVTTTGGTLSVAGGMSTVLKSAGLTISRYSMSGE